MRNQSKNIKSYLLLKLTFFIILFYLSGCFTGKEYYEYDRGLPVYGYIEDVLIESDNLILTAKLDSGSDISAINAPDFTEFKKNGEHWIKFNLINPETNKKIEFEKKIIRWETIKQNDISKLTQPIVLMKVKIGKNEYFRNEFLLADLSEFDYQVLLGRNYLNGIALIDVSQKNMAKTK